MDDARTVWCGNLSDQVTEELLYELFLQAAPLERVKIPTDREGKKSNFAFITFKHEISVNYAAQLLNGTCLFDKPLNVKPRNKNSLERTPLHNEYQNSLRQGINHNDLSRLGQLMQHNYDHRSSNSNDHRHRSNQNEARWEHNNYDWEDRHRDNHRAYKKHDYHDNRHSDSPRRRNNYIDRKNNFTDRNSRRNNHY